MMTVEHITVDEAINRLEAMMAERMPKIGYRIVTKDDHVTVLDDFGMSVYKYPIVSDGILWINHDR